MFKKLCNSVALPLLAAAFASSPALFAQTLVTGDIAGHVVDPTGASVANASVTLTSLQDGSSQIVKTNKDGGYRFPLLRPGFYSVHEQGAGMTSDAPRVAVNVGQATDVELIAQPNGGTTTVEVTTNQPLLQNQDANISTTFSTEQLENLPIPGGDISNLPFSTPGANLSTGEGYGNFTVFGLPSTSNLFTTNGSDLMDAYLNLPNSGASNNVLGGNELAEAAIVVNGYTGQYGRLAGAQVNFTTKSGTNKFHGNANLYYNSSGLNANDWFLKQSEIGGLNAQPHAVSRQWGGSIGGPIWKDKLFVFFDDEGLRYVLPGGGSTKYLPSTAFQNAVLTNIKANQPAEYSFYQTAFNLYSGANGFKTAVPDTTAGDGGGCGDFEGTTSNGVTFGQANPCAVSYIPNNANLNTEQLYSVRIDANLSSKDQINARFKHDWGVQATSTDPINPAFSANSVQPEYEGQLNETHIFSTNVVNSFTIASLYYSAVFGPPNFNAALATFPTTFTFSDGDGFASLGGSDNSYPSGRNVSQYQVTDDLAITKGRNSIKTGYNFRRYNITNFAPLAGASGVTAFASNTDFFNGIISAATAANGHTGTSTTSVTFPAIGAAHAALYSIGVYVQDQFAATRNLNLTASLRFDRGGDPKCANSCFVRTVAPFDQVAHTATIPYNQTILTGQANAFNDVEKVTIQPRFGFAITPFGPNSKTVIRGGGGLFADLPVASVLTRFITSAPNDVTFPVTPVAASGSGATAMPAQNYLVQPGIAGSGYVTAAASNRAFQTGFASGGTLASIQTAVAAQGSVYATPSYTASVTNKLLNPKFAEFNLEIQQAVTKHDVFDINYVGNIGFDVLFVNPTANAYAYCAGAAATSSTGAVNPNGYCPSGSFPDLPSAQIDARFKAVSILTNNGHSNYNGVVTSYRHQGGHGLTLAVNYNYSKALDNTSNGGVEGFNAGSEATYVLSQIDPMSVDKFNYGPADYDTRHSLTANYTWIIPGKFSNHLMQQALGGWIVSGTVFSKSGLPYSIVRGSLAAGVTNSTNGGSTLGAFLGGPLGPCGNPRNQCVTTSQYVEGRPIPNSLTTKGNPAGQYQFGFGNQARNSYRGPDYTDTDMQLSKTFTVFEGVKLKFGANAFNLLNHPNFAAPNNNLATTSTFGKIQADVPPVSSPYGNFQGAGVSGRILQVVGGITF